VVYLAGPAAEAINGEVFVVHGGVAAVLDPPRVRAAFHAAEHGSTDGMWTLESVPGASRTPEKDSMSLVNIGRRSIGRRCSNSLSPRRG
jgi:3-oxoacyl-[acyl-carrier protein] reductase